VSDCRGSESRSTNRRKLSADGENENIKAMVQRCLLFSLMARVQTRRIFVYLFNDASKLHRLRSNERQIEHCHAVWLKR
jgi:hypothetical protein